MTQSNRNYYYLRKKSIQQELAVKSCKYQQTLIENDFEIYDKYKIVLHMIILSSILNSKKNSNLWNELLKNISITDINYVYFSRYIIKWMKNTSLN